MDFVVHQASNRQGEQNQSCYKGFGALTLLTERQLERATQAGHLI